MKLISLNTWQGRIGKDKLLNFFWTHKDTDIFCLQEIWSSEYKEIEGNNAEGMSIDQFLGVMFFELQEISTLLSNHKAYFKPHYQDNFGLLMLVKKDLEVISEGDVFVHKERGFIPKDDFGFHANNLQFVTISTPKGNRTILNFHGLWNGQGKGDSEDRLLQSDRIINFIKTLPNPYVLSGDFNLSPNTESIKKFEDFGLNNLIKEYGITSTRTSLYNKQEKFADYTFVNDKIVVKDFKVLPDEVSDHTPLYLEFE